MSFRIVSRFALVAFLWSGNVHSPAWSQVNTVTGPQLYVGSADSSNAAFVRGAPAVSEPTVSAVTFGAVGTNTNINLVLSPKGSGQVVTAPGKSIAPTSLPTAFAPGDLRLFGWEDTTDDQTAVFTSALAALPATGGVIAIPPSVNGTTLGNITINKPVTIRGLDGGLGTLYYDSESPAQLTEKANIRAQTSTTTVFTVTASFVTLENISFSPAIGVVKQVSGSYVSLTSASARFRGDQISCYEYKACITTTGATHTMEVTRTRCLLYKTGGGQSDACIHLQGGADVRIDQLIANGPSSGTTDSKAGIWVESVADALITNANIIALGTDLLVSPGDNQGVTSLWLNNVFLDSAYRGADFAPTGTGAISRSRLSNVWASSHSDAGIRVAATASNAAAVDGLDIDVPHVFLNTGYGILLAGGINTRIRGGQVAQNGGTGIQVGAGVTDFSIQGVTSGTTSGLSANGGYGINIAAGASDRYILLGNSTFGNTSGGISDGGTGTNKSALANITSP